MSNNVFINELNHILKNDLPKNIINFPVYDTEICNYGNVFNLPYTPYGNIWIYNTKLVKEVGLFNKYIIGWGIEEKELEFKYNRKCNLKTINYNTKFPILHLSHNNSLRNFDKKIYEKNRKIFENKKLNFNYDNNFVDYKLIKKYNYGLPIKSDLKCENLIKVDNKIYQILKKENNNNLIYENDSVCIYDYFKNKIYLDDKKIKYSPTRIFFWKYNIDNNKLVLKNKNNYLNLKNLSISNNKVINQYKNLGSEKDYYNFINKKLKIKNFNNFKLDKKYNKYNKISIIGPADHIDKLNKKKSYDNSITVRCNTSINIVGKNNFGNTLNLYFHVVSLSKENGGIFDVKKLKDFGCSDIIFVYPPLETRSKSTFYNISTIKDYISIYDKLDLSQFNLWHIDENEYINLEKKLKSRPNCGLLMMHMIINKFHKTHKIDIDGFTFFETNYSKGIRDVIDDLKSKNNFELALKRMNTSGWHKQLPQKKYLKELIKDKTNVNLDLKLKNILENL